MSMAPNACGSLKWESQAQGDPGSDHLRGSTYGWPRPTPEKPTLPKSQGHDSYFSYWAPQCSMCVCMLSHMLGHSVMSDSVWPSVHVESPGKNTGMGCHALFQGIFLTQGWKLCLLHLPNTHLYVCYLINTYSLKPVLSLCTFCIWFVAEKKTILTPCWKSFLWHAFHCFCYYNHINSLPQRTLPYWKLKYLCSAHREIIWAGPSMNRYNKKKRLIHPIQRLAVLGDVLEDWRPFHFTSPLALLLYSAFWLKFLIASLSLTL